MRRILAASLFLLLLASTVAAYTVLEYESYPDKVIVRKNSTYVHVVKIRIGSNYSTGPLIINVMFNASDPWIYERYEATLNSTSVKFNVSENDVVLENRTVHRISFYNDSLSLPPPDPPAELVLKVYLLSPNTTGDFAIDTGGIYVPDYTALPLKHTSVKVVRPGDLDGNGRITFYDLIGVLNLILSNKYNSVADLNNNGEIDFDDLIKVLNIILQG